MRKTCKVRLLSFIPIGIAGSATHGSRLAMSLVIYAGAALLAQGNPLERSAEKKEPLQVLTSGGTTKVSIQFPAGFSFQFHHLSAPERVFFDVTGEIPAIASRSPYAFAVHDSVVVQVRMARKETNVTRVVFDLAQDAKVSAVRDASSNTLQVELKPKDPYLSSHLFRTQPRVFKPPVRKALRSEPLTIIAPPTSDGIVTPLRTPAPLTAELQLLAWLEPPVPMEPVSSPDPNLRAKELAERAVQEARADRIDSAVALFRQAIALAPNDVPILRDYAVVLGWGERYSEAVGVIKKTLGLQQEQPDWALEQFSRSYLFGGNVEAALDLLNKLVSRGDTSEPVLLRRALALRWLHQSSEAQAAYEVAVKLYPKSGAARAGVVYSMGDQDKLVGALRTADTGLSELPDNPDLLKAKVRVLNWMGHHFEAQKMLDKVPDSMRNDREILEDRLYAARWGGNPAEAVNVSKRLESTFADNQQIRTLTRDTRLAFGNSLQGGFRYVSDSDGLIDRTRSGEFGIHLTPGQQLHAGYSFRDFLLTTPLSLRRYELGWSGVVTRRIGSYATASEVDYDRTGIHKIIGDGGLSVIMNDSSRLILGGGTIAMDAFNAIAHSVTGPFFSGELVLTPAYRSRIDVRYAQYRFSDGVRRDRSDLEGLQQVTSNPYAKIRFGWRSNLMWHDRGTDDFYSPASFMAHMMVAQSYGKIARSLDYFAEVSGGWQSETATPLQHPLQISGRLVWNPRENVRILLELGRTTSSLERVIPDRNSYHRRFASIGLNYMF